MNEPSRPSASSAKTGPPVPPEQQYAPLTQNIAEADPMENRPRRNPTPYLMAGVLLIGLVSIVWIGYMRGLETRRRAAPVPRITVAEPYKVRAESPDTGPTDHADKRIFDQVDGYAPATATQTPDLPLPIANGIKAPDQTIPEPAPKLRQRPATKAKPGNTLQVAPTPAPGATAASPPDSRYRVQLSSRRSREEALMAWTRIVSAHGDLFSGLEKSIQRADLGERGIFFRLRVLGFADADAARKLCALYKSRGGDCFVVRS